LRIVRRPRRRPLVAASQPIADPQQVFRSTLWAGSGTSSWQDDAWDMLDAVGELRYYVGWRAASCSRVRLVASDVNPDTGMPTGSTDNPRVNDIVGAIAGGPLGQAQVVKRLTECLTVPGEVWLAIITTTDGVQRWLVLTREEIRRNGRGVEVELPDGTKHSLNPPTDSLIRIWNPRPRRATEPDSPVRACLDSLHEIVRTTKTISNASKSRLIGNGVVFVPQEMTLPPVNVPVAAGGTPPVTEGTPAVQQLQELLWQVANTAYDDEDSMAALIPMFATVPGDQVKNVQHLKFENTVTDLAIKIRNDAIARLAMGLDVSPERLLGLGQTTNHWSMWGIGDEDVQLHITPVMETICAAINTEVLKVVFERENIDPAKYVMWYDAGELTADPDKTDNAAAAFTAGAITAEAYRDYLGLDADSGYDYTTLEGWQTWAQDHVSTHPELLPTLAPLLGPISEAYPELSATYSPPTPPVIEAVPPAPAAPQSEPATENIAPPPPGARADQVQMAIVDLMVGRALELAGKRRRTRADHARLRDIPIHETHRFMPPVAEADIPKLIDGWDAALEADVLARLGIDADDLKTQVRRAVRRELTTQVVDA